jgi:HAMP domain-containing protein
MCGGSGVGFGEQGLDCLESFRAGVEHTDLSLRRVHGMRHQPVQGSEVIVGTRRSVLIGRITKQRTEGASAHADVEPKHIRPVQLRGIVEVAVVFGDERGEWQPVRKIKLALGVVVDEGIARARAVSWPEELDPRVPVRNALDDGVLDHKPPNQVNGTAVGPRLPAQSRRLPRPLSACSGCSVPRAGYPVALKRPTTTSSSACYADGGACSE